jgi:hypothetical protein
MHSMNAVQLGKFDQSIFTRASWFWSTFIHVFTNCLARFVRVECPKRFLDLFQARLEHFQPPPELIVVRVTKRCISIVSPP